MQSWWIAHCTLENVGCPVLFRRSQSPPAIGKIAHNGTAPGSNANMLIGSSAIGFSIAGCIGTHA
jgi:hypothetical protein